MIERLRRSERTRPARDRMPRCERHGVVRDRELPGDVAGWQAVRLVLHQEAEHVEAGRLGKGREGEDDVF